MFWLVSVALAADAAPKIINGDSADGSVHPEAGAMLADIGGVKYVMCSSTLIAPDVVLLAAHCVDPSVLGATPDGYGWSRQSDLTAYLSGREDWPDDAIVGSATASEPGWDYASLDVGLALNHDIALLFLDEAVEDGPLGYLPTPAEATQLDEGTPVVIVGWGMTDSSDTASAGSKHWGESTIDAIADYEFQVGAETDAVRKCHGDSGGPSFAEVETDSPIRTRVVGVTSHAFDMTDCLETGGVDTRVDYYLDWIDEAMVAACDDGTRVWCETPGILEPPIPKTDAELKADLALVGCSTGGGSLAWAPAFLAGALLFRRRR